MMKFQIGQVKFEVNLSNSSSGIRLELTANVDNENVKGGLSVSYWKGSENPLIVKMEIETEGSHAKESLK
jgi:hypothetical protein